MHRCVDAALGQQPVHHRIDAVAVVRFDARRLERHARAAGPGSERPEQQLGRRTPADIRVTDDQDVSEHGV